MSAVKFFLFGKFCFKADSKIIHKIEPHKAAELLGFLLLNREKPHAREKVADLLWGEIAPEQSKSYFRKTLWQLQTILEPYCGSSILLVDGEWIQINPEFYSRTDIAVVEKTFISTQGIQGKDLKEEQFRIIQNAVEFYRGELLEGWYQDWCLFERERLQYICFAMLDKLIEHCEVHGYYEKGLIFGERILHYDRAREHTYRQLMRLHYLAGDRTAALRKYQKCEAVLRKELDVEPAESTRTLYEMIRADKLEGPDQSSQFGKSEVAQGEADSLRAVFSHMNAFQKTLSQIQTQLTQDLRLIQRTIKTNRF
jgi:DNA-binding SARP family transcriptional activator